MKNFFRIIRNLFPLRRGQWHGKEYVQNTDEAVCSFFQITETGVHKILCSKFQRAQNVEHARMTHRATRYHNGSSGYSTDKDLSSGNSCAAQQTRNQNRRSGLALLYVRFWAVFATSPSA
jgi:hypothetical protein